MKKLKTALFFFVVSLSLADIAFGQSTTPYNNPMPKGGVAIGGQSSTTTFVPLEFDASGNLNVNVAAGGGAGGTSSSFGAAFPATGTAVGMSDGTDMVPFISTDGVSLDVNCTVGCAGGSFNNNADDVATSATNGQSAAWVYLWDGAAFDRAPGNATDGALVNLGANNDVDVTGTVGLTDTELRATPVPISGTVTVGTFPDNEPFNLSQLNGTTVSTSNGAVGAGTLRVTLATNGTGVVGLNAGTNNIGDVDVASIAAGNTNIGDVDAQPLAATTGGTSLFTLTAANTTNATNVKASAGQIYGLSGYTISATPAWLSLYNNAGTPTCGTNIIQQYLIPGSAAGAGFNIDFALGKTFATGIAFCLTTGIAGTGAVAASSYVVNVDYE